MDRKNLRLFSPPFCYPQQPINPPIMYYQIPTFQQARVVNNMTQIQQQQALNTKNNNVLYNQISSHSNINDSNQSYSCFQQNYPYHYPLHQQIQQDFSREIITYGNVEDDMVGYDQLTHDLNNSDQSQLKNFKNIPQQSNILISTSIIIQEGQNTQIKEERNIIRDKSISVKINESDDQKISIKMEEQKKRITANWRFIDVSGNRNSFERIPIILKTNDIQLSINRENYISQNQKILKLQPEDIPEQISVKNEISIKIHNIQENQNTLKMNSLQSEQGYSSQSIQQNNSVEKETHQLGGNLCKNLMRAFNKFAQNYNFSDQSIKVSLFRFLERNTYSNLQLLKIYHNPRYKSIFMEFAQDGAKKLLLQSKITDINSHMDLLQKIIEGDISSIGIKKRKNVSKIITTNIKKKQYGKKSSKKKNEIYQSVQ